MPNILKVEKTSNKQNAAQNISESAMTIHYLISFILLIFFPIFFLSFKCIDLFHLYNLISSYPKLEISIFTVKKKLLVHEYKVHE